MNSWQIDISELQEAFGHPSHVEDDEPIEFRDVELRAELLREEVREALEAMTGTQWEILEMSTATETGQDMTEAIDALVDIIVVTLGAACAWGVDLEPIWDEVHRTNMAKVNGPVREDGKQLRPPGWKPPNVADLLFTQDSIKRGR